MKKQECPKCVVGTKRLRRIGLQQFPALLYSCDQGKAAAGKVANVAISRTVKRLWLEISHMVDGDGRVLWKKDL
jgi:hypothetical protein